MGVLLTKLNCNFSENILLLSISSKIKFYSSLFKKTFFVSVSNVCSSEKFRFVSVQFSEMFSNSCKRLFSSSARLLVRFKTYPPENPLGHRALVEAIGESKDQTAFFAWHPRQEFPYEFTRYEFNYMNNH